MPSTKSGYGEPWADSWPAMSPPASHPTPPFSPTCSHRLGPWTCHPAGDRRRVPLSGDRGGHDQRAGTRLRHLVETRRFAADYLAEQFSPDSLKAAATDELTALLPILRRLPRRIDRISQALETGRLSINMRLLADDRDRRFVTGLVHQILLAFLAAASGIMAVLILGIHGGPSLTTTVTVYQFLGYCLLVIAAILALRVLVTVLRPHQD